jgi:hypothetical protein
MPQITRARKATKSSKYLKFNKTKIIILTFTTINSTSIKKKTIENNNKKFTNYYRYLDSLKSHTR